MGKAMKVEHKSLGWENLWMTCMISGMWGAPRLGGGAYMRFTFTSDGGV